MQKDRTLRVGAISAYTYYDRMLKYFKDEFEAHIKGQAVSTGTCRL